MPYSERREEAVRGERLVVHMVGNAHIDPVWLWNWQAGVDEAIASFHSAADRCDEYPEFIYTRGEAWLYRQVETLDPKLFERIRALVARGQWHISGGQFLQPDVNAPTVSGLRKQFEHGRHYFSTRFGVRPDVGYNLDSFGHPATLPDILADCGYRGYVFHRPKPDQVELPASTFRWRGSGGAEVLAFRIIPGYTTLGEDLTEQVRIAIQNADHELGHTMCFFGVGNHGGGPTKADIEYILANRLSSPGVELRFSTPEAFFDEVEKRRDRLPVVNLELQHAFPGCYSVMHDIKQAQRHGEHLLDHARAAIDTFGADSSEGLISKVEAAWEDLLFTSFHDILAGTSVPSSWESVRAMQGRARIAAEEVLVETTRPWSQERLPAINHQQLIVMNPDERERRGWLEAEPWLDMDPWGGRWLSDIAGNPVEFQLVQPEAPQITSRILIPAAVPARGATQLLVRDDTPPDLQQRDGELWASADGLGNDDTRLRVDSHGIASLAWRGLDLLGAGGIGLHLRRDSTDTWTFNTDRFTEPVEEVFATEAWVVEESGPLRARLRSEGRIGTSRLRWTIDLYRGEAAIAMRLEINFDERFRLLQLPLRLASTPASWTAGLAGGQVERQPSESEWPVQGWARVGLSAGRSNAEETNGPQLAVLTQDVYSSSLSGDSWQWTLLRSPRMAWGGGDNLTYAGRDWFTDQGPHVFDLRLRFGNELSTEELSRDAEDLARPLISFDRYRGMNRPLGRRASSAPVQALFQQDDDGAS